MQFLTGEVVRKLVQQLSRWYLLLCALIKKNAQWQWQGFCKCQEISLISVSCFD